MVTQAKGISKPYPNALEMTSEEFESSISTYIPEEAQLAIDVSAIALEVNVMSANAEAAVAALPNAMWVSGTYALGAVAWSPLDFLDYRCKTAGSRTIDPSLDPTNWQLRTKTSAGGADTTSSGVDVTLTSTSGRLQIVAMTSSGKKLFLPSAVTLTKGANIYVVKNSGVYRFSVHKNGGGFVCYIQPGQVVAFNCSDVSTAAGVWQNSGQNVESIYDGNNPEVLNAVDSRNIAVAMMSATKAICAYRNNSTGFLWAVVLNYGSASGSPLQINSENSISISVAAQTSGQTTVVYQVADTVKGYVLDISGNTITPGAVATINTGTGSAARGTSLCVLSSTKLLCAYCSTTAATVLERVLDIASSVITPSSQVTADSGSATRVHNQTQVSAISSSKAAVSYKANGSPSVTVRLQSISGSTPAPTGSALTVADFGTVAAVAYAFVVLSTDRALLIQASNLANTDLMFSLLDISGTSAVLLCRKQARMNLIDNAYVNATKLDANNVYVTWNGGGSGGADSTIIKITSGDRILIGALSEKIDPSIAVADGYVACAALDSTHVMQACRNSSTFLSAKTLEIAA